MTKQEQTQLLRLIGNGKVKEAIDDLMKLELDSSRKNMLTGIAAQYQTWKQNNIKGILSTEEINLQRNQIVNRLIEFINQSEVEKSITSATSSTTDKRPLSQKKAVLWLGIIGSIASIIGLWFVFFPTTTDDSTQIVTVLAHGTKGKDDPVLPNRGLVYLIYGDAKIPEQINNEGEATFKQIPNSFFSAEAKVEILFEDPEGEPYRAAVPDSLYDLKPNSYIGLEVILEGMDQISGIVKDFDTGEPIDSVTVRVFGKDTRSNQFGEFVLDLPQKQQQKFITLRAFKAGYQRWEKADLPTTTENEIIIPLKKQ